MATVSVKASRDGEGQIVHLPREMAFEDDVELEVTRSGDVITMHPKKRLSFQEGLRLLMEMPGPPTVEKWNDEDIADRPGVEELLAGHECRGAASRSNTGGDRSGRRARRRCIW